MLTEVDASFDVTLPHEQKVTENETFTLTATLSIDKPVTWYKDGVPIALEDTHYQITSEGTTHTLTVTSAELDDEAEYSLSVDKRKTQTQVIVQGMVYYLLFFSYNMFFWVILFLNWQK